MVADRLAKVKARIAAAARRVGRDPSQVVLVAVGKSQPRSLLEEAYRAGQRDFGENRADEMLEKAAGMPADVRWHFVGGLQSRKASAIRPVTHLLHSMDRASLARRWATGEGEPPASLLQVNIGHEAQKHGVAPESASEVLAELREIGIEPVGLMAIPPLPETAEASRPFFRSMLELFEALKADHPRFAHLSMGMTDDFEVAVEEGATIVRVGRAIFGPR